MVSNRFAGFTLVATFLFSFNALWGTLYRNGYISALLSLSDNGPPYMLPGTSIPLLLRYTGIPWSDKVAAFAVVIFANVTDGSMPQLSLLAFHLSGQFAVIVSLVLIEGMRAGNRGGLMSW